MKSTAAIAATAVAAVAVAACGSSAPPYQDAQTCKGLAAATSLVASGAYGLSGGNTYTPIAQMQVAISDAPKGALSPGFRRDVLTVVSTRLNNPSAATVARLQGDCDRLGITKRIWPEQLTG